jgi:pimeloyl-ACP methyl ester carboxylesterase
MKPTIVLVHGAFAESASWDGVIDPLLDAGHPVIAAANPLRSVAADAAAIADVVRSVDGPVVLAAHSYGRHGDLQRPGGRRRDRRARLRQWVRPGAG